MSGRPTHLSMQRHIPTRLKELYVYQYSTVYYTHLECATTIYNMIPTTVILAV